MSLRNWKGSEVHCYGCGREYDAYPEDEFLSASQPAKATIEHLEHIWNSSVANCQEERDEWVRTAYGVEG